MEGSPPLEFYGTTSRASQGHSEVKYTPKVITWEIIPIKGPTTKWTPTNKHRMMVYKS